MANVIAAKTTTKFGFKNNKSHEHMVGSGAGQAEYQDLPLFKLEDLMVGTNEFCEINKLGQGGFGSVYKVITNFLFILNY